MKKIVICVLFLTLFYFTFLFVKDTFAIDSSESFLTCAEGEVNTYLLEAVCCPSSSNRVQKAGENYYCISSNMISNTDNYVGVQMVDSNAVCSVTSSAGIIYGEDKTCSVSLGSEWSTIDGTCFLDALVGRVCQCKSALSVCGATVAGKPYCSNGGVMTDDGCKIGYYTITYNANGGSGAPSSQTGTIGSTVILSSQEPTRSGYAFTGWMIDSIDGSYGIAKAGGGPYNFDFTASDGEVVLYAKWEELEKACYACGNSTGAVFKWGNYENSDSCYLQSSYSTEASCLAQNNEYGCYACGNSTGAVFKWGKFATCEQGGNCTFQSQYSTEEKCLAANNSSSGGGESDTPSTPTIYKVNINYSVNGGTVTSSTTDSDGTVYNWKTDSNGIISVSVDGGSYEVKTYTMNYGEELGDSGLIDYNNAKVLNVIRTGYTAVSGAEWKCLTGDCKDKTYDQSKVYNASDFCDASSSDCTVTLGVNWNANSYKISYTANGGIINGLPTSADYDSEIIIKNPNKTVTVTGNVNKTDATVGKAVSSEQKFAGWTSSTIDTKIAYHGDAAWTNGNSKVTDTLFKNLTSVNDATVTMVANWTPVELILPTVTKEGYICNWNTKADGKGTTYASGGKYVPTADSNSSVNLYAICISSDSSKTDDEITTNSKTGDVLIVIAWVMGIGALCYSVYYFRSRKFD